MRDDIAFAGQSQRYVAPLLGLQVESDALLTAVDREEVGAEAGPPVDAEQSPDFASLARLNLDHLGAHVGEEERCVRPLLGDCEVEDADSV